jgi:Double-GTPase 2
MEDGFGYLIGGLILLAIIVYLAVIVAGIAVTGFIAVLSTVSFAGAATGIFVGGKNFYEIFLKTHKQAKVKLPNAKIKRFLSRIYYVEQPAYLMYGYDAGWFVLQRVALDVWEPTDSNARSWFSKGSDFISEADSKSNAFLKIFFLATAVGTFIGGLCHYIAAFLIVAIFTLLQSIFLIFACIATSIAIIILGIGTFIYSSYYKIYHRCPSCHHQMSIPVHICPNCSTKHDRLWPSAYGILSHRCVGKLPNGTTCNEKLPTLAILGQKKLLKKCPECGRVLEGLEGTNIHIPIVGGPGVGKSHYIVTATRELMEKHAPAFGWNVSLPDTEHRRDYEKCVGLINAGKRLAKTSDADISAKAYNLQIKHNPKQVVPKLLYLYDAAGEYYTSETKAEEQIYFKYVHGILLIIDPFSIDNVRNAYKERLNDDKTNGGIISPSGENLDTVYENMLMLFETKLNHKRNKKMNTPIAVVVTKCDAFDLEERIGEAAANQYTLDHPKAKIRRLEDAIDKVVEEFLIDSGAGNFVRNLRSHYKTVRFFSCSAVGIGNNSESASSFEGVRVLEPLLWLLRQV